MRTQPQASTASPTFPYLTWAQLKRKYPDQWVLLLNPVSATSGYRVKGGEFVAASTAQMGTLDAANSLPEGSRISVIYTGSVDLPASTALCL